MIFQTFSIIFHYEYKISFYAFRVWSENSEHGQTHFATHGAAVTSSNPHLYLSIVTHFRSLRARGFEFGPSLNKFGVGVSRETKKHNLFALFRWGFHLDIANESSSSSVSFFSWMVGLYWRSLITESSLEDLCSLNHSFILSQKSNF